MATASFTEQKCVPCKQGGPALTGENLAAYRQKLPPAWDLVEHHHLERAYHFEDFRQALAFTQAVGQLAEDEGHHPVLVLSWGRVVLRLWTHQAGGLTANDFVLAAKADELFLAGWTAARGAAAGGSPRGPA